MKRTYLTLAVVFLFLAALPLSAQTGTWTNAREPKWQGVGRTTASFRYSLWVD